MVNNGKTMNLYCNYNLFYLKEHKHLFNFDSKGLTITRTKDIILSNMNNNVSQKEKFPSSQYIHN